VSLLSNAEAVLRANWAGSSTVPSRRQYPHQWGWDAAFVAIGWSWIDAGARCRRLVGQDDGPRLFRDGLSRSDSGNYWSAGLGGSGSYVPYARSMPSPALSRTP
jgi:hypothetical protein